MIDAEEARKRWLQERPKYQAFGEFVAARLRLALLAQGIWCETTSRPKEIHSLVKKLLKGKHAYDTLPDKVGARCVLRYLSELDTVVTIARGLFQCAEIDQKLEKLVAESRVGYASIHVDVRLKQDDREAENYPPARYSAELQIRTLGQHLWSEMTHDNFYKNEETLAILPPGVKRRVDLMSGLIEVADREFDRLNQEIPLDSAANLYKALEHHYYKLTAKRPDPELSLEVIRLLEPLYDLDPKEIARRIDDFVASHESVLHSVYAEADEWKVSAFLYQPEVLMIYERLEADPLATRKVWVHKFPETELERIAVAFGISFD